MRVGVANGTRALLDCSDTPACRSSFLGFFEGFRQSPVALWIALTELSLKPSGELLAVLLVRKPLSLSLGIGCKLHKALSGLNLVNVNPGFGLARAARIRYAEVCCFSLMASQDNFGRPGLPGSTM